MVVNMTLCENCHKDLLKKYGDFIRVEIWKDAVRVNIQVFCNKKCLKEFIMPCKKKKR